MTIGSPELVDFFLRKGASMSCPEQLDYDWLYPDASISETERRIDPELYSGSAFQTTNEGVFCNGQRSMSCNLRSMCRECEVRDIVFTEMNASTYLKILGPTDPTPRRKEIYGILKSPLKPR